jgi:hypothetical protein
MYRVEEGLGLWEHRGKVAVVGIGHSPTFRQYSANCTAVPKQAGVPQSDRIAADPGIALPAFAPPW